VNSDGFVLPAVLLLALSSAGQSSSDHVAEGDAAYAAFRAEAALKQFEAAIGAGASDPSLLVKASRTAVDIGEGLTDSDRQAASFRLGEQYARRAVEVAPRDAESQFALARALGRTALSVGVRTRVRYAVEVRDHALAALRLHPDHPGALHVMGMWNAEIMRLSGFERFLARTIMGGAVLKTASWSEAVRYLERAVEVDPDRLTHHLDLGLVYRDVGETSKAVTELGTVVNGPRSDVNDPLYKRQAQAALAKIKK
jgi:tetratricopeptide (TPR) repeat protein